jgi:hypothetical protein
LNGHNSSARQPSVAQILAEGGSDLVALTYWKSATAEMRDYGIDVCLLKRPVGRPSLDVRRSYANFTYQAGSWTKPRRVVAKVECLRSLRARSALDGVSWVQGG